MSEDRKVRETCPCGAEFEGDLTSPFAQDELGKFREAHDPCRKAAAEDLARGRVWESTSRPMPIAVQEQVEELRRRRPPLAKPTELRPEPDDTGSAA